jgi:hypothetical protein
MWDVVSNGRFTHPKCGNFNRINIGDILETYWGYKGICLRCNGIYWDLKGDPSNNGMAKLWPAA